jgi:hypothetical protein
VLEPVAALEKIELDLAEVRRKTCTHRRENRCIGGNNEAGSSASGLQGEGFPAGYSHKIGERLSSRHVRRYEPLSDLPKTV